MTKEAVLAIFSRSGRFLSPDEARVNLRPSPNRRSFYSYLLRLSSVKMAKDSGATEEEIREAISSGITDPPNAIPERVEEVRGRFLS